MFSEKCLPLHPLLRTNASWVAQGTQERVLWTDYINRVVVQEAVFHDVSFVMRVEDRVKTNRRFNQGALNYKTVRPVTDKTNLLPFGQESTFWIFWKKYKDILQWRVWSWLRMNASYRLNTCKSRGSMYLACQIRWRPAHGWVTRIQPAHNHGTARRKAD